VKSAKAKAAKPRGIQRRDRSGHIDPKYGAELRAKGSRSEEERPFLRRSRTKDSLAEQLGEEVVGEATSGEYEAEDDFNQEVAEERGGPFVVTNAGQEFDYEPDASNPKGARREPFPRT
jgi:hypothetical protein